MSASTYKSSCACGAVELEISGEPAAQVYCHCDSCRSWLNAPLHAAALWPLKVVKVVKGADNLGLYKRTVSNALRWLRTQQQPDGSLGFHEAGDHGGMYNHALATMALAELYGTSRDFTLRRAAESAVAFCLKAQNPNLGWKYRIKQGKNDTSVTGWMVLALKAEQALSQELRRPQQEPRIERCGDGKGEAVLS